MVPFFCFSWIWAKKLSVKCVKIGSYFWFPGSFRLSRGYHGVHGTCVDDFEASYLVEFPPRPMACPKVSTRMTPVGARRAYVYHILFIFQGF